MDNQDSANNSIQSEVSALRAEIDRLKALEDENKRLSAALLNLSGENYRAIFDAANDAIFVHDIEAGRFIDINQKACEMFCYPKDELMRLSVGDISSDESPYDGSAIRSYMTKAANGEPQLFETIVKDKANRFFWVEINMKRAVVNGAYRLLSIVRDISERKLAEERLARINEVFLSFGTDAAENIDKLVSLCGQLMGAQYALYNRIEDGMIFTKGRWNFPENFGGRDTAQGHICFDVVMKGGEDITVIHNLPDTDYARNESAIREYDLRTYVGIPVRFSKMSVGSLCVFYQYDYYPAESDKEIMGFIASAIGIEEERKNAEDINQLAQFSIDKAGDSIFWIGADAKILYANEIASNLLGYSHEELLNMTAFDIDPDFTPDIWPSHWQEVKKARSFVFESRHRRKNGTFFPVEITVNYMDFQGEEYNFTFARDITERKKSESDLIRRDYQLEILSRTSQHVNAVLEIPIITRTLVAAAMELVGATGGSAGLVVEGNMVFSEYNKEGRLYPISYSFEPGHGVPGWVAKAMRPYITNDAEHDSQIFADKKERFALYNLVSVPILSSKGVLLGCFEIYNKENRMPFDAQDVFMLQGLAASAAVALENARAFIDHKKYEDALKESESLKASILNAVPHAIVVLRNRKFLYANEGMRAVFGWDPEEVIGKSTRIVYRSDEEFDEIGKDFYMALERQESFRKEFLCRRRDGTDIICIMSASRIGDCLEDNKIVLMYEDITQRKHAEEALRESERQYRMTIDSITDAIHVVDADLRIVLYNKAFKKWGAELSLPRIVNGMTIAEAFPFLPDKVLDEYRRVFATGKPLITQETTLVGGSEFMTETHKFPIFEHDKTVRVLTIVSNITENVRLQKEHEYLNKEILKSNRKLKQLVLKDAQTGLYNHRYLTEALESELYRARRYANALSIIMIDIDYFKSINELYGHEFGDLVLKQFADFLRKLVRRYDIVVRFGGEEFVIISPGIERGKAAAMAHRILEAINMYGFGDAKHVVKLKLSISVVSYPDDKVGRGLDMINLAEKILTKVKNEGGNKVYSTADVSGETQDKADILEDTGVRVLKEKIEKLTTMGRQNLIESIFAFAKTIELRDQYTGEHVESTVRYSTDIAKALKLSPEEIDNIRQASVLHDLGKIGISDKILRKRSKLTAREYEQIKKHPQIAADIIRPIQFMHDIIPLVLYHHERWDGKGYPAGLKGEEIPIGARIIAVADVYQALTSNRPYRKAFSMNKAIEILKKEAGTHFDPRIVSVFVKILREHKYHTAKKPRKKKR